MVLQILQKVRHLVLKCQAQLFHHPQHHQQRTAHDVGNVRVKRDMN
jgi:hypothetical protein